MPNETANVSPGHLAAADDRTASNQAAPVGSPRIVFMGTPEFAVASLDAIVQAGYNVVGIVTAPDKPAGRGMQLTESAVKKYAVTKGLFLLQPEKLRDPGFGRATRVARRSANRRSVPDASRVGMEYAADGYRQSPRIVVAAISWRGADQLGRDQWGDHHRGNDLQAPAGDRHGRHPATGELSGFGYGYGRRCARPDEGNWGAAFGSDHPGPGGGYLA